MEPGRAQTAGADGLSVVARDTAGQLLERDQSIAALTSLLASVRDDSAGKLVWVSGEAGVGKTALLRSFCQMQERQFRILWGACQPLRTPRPLAPLLDVVEVTGGELAELAELADGAARPHEVAAALVRELRRRAPTVLVLEDLHWTDEATLDVLTLLAARIELVPALVIASYRDDELDRAPQLRQVLGELVRRPQRLKVLPLSPATVAALAEPHGLDPQELYQRTGGNPFYVTEVLAAGGELIPETVHDAVLARSARLSEPARRLLEAVAIGPGQTELWLLQALAGALTDHLGECLSSGVLTSGTVHVAFRHELARLAVEEAIPPNRRLDLHHAALDALENHGAEDPDLARLAHHADAAGDPQAVLRWAPCAAEWAAASGAHCEAAAQFERALRFADRLPADELAQLLERHSSECFLTNRFGQAIESAERALLLRRELRDQLRVGGAMCSLAQVLHKGLGSTPGAAVLAGEAVALLEPLGQTRELARAYDTRSQMCMVLSDLDGALEWGTRAIELAERLDETETLVHALNNVGTAMLDAGCPAGAEKLERSLQLARHAGLDGDVGRAFNNLVGAAVAMRDYSLAERYVGPGIEFCEERGLELWRQHMLANQARLQLDRARWEEAADSARQLLRDPATTAHPRVEALVIIALVRARRGDPQVRESLEEALALARDTGELQMIGPVAAARAEAAWLEGRSAEVAAATDDALALALRQRNSRTVAWLAWWRRRANVHDHLAPGAAAGPYALSIAGDWAGAAHRCAEIGCPYEAALALADADREAALRQAFDELMQLGARPAATIVAQRLRARGARGIPRGPRPATSENPAGLTSRELEVLALLREGLPNAQIAQRLVISPKTADHHVSAILRKLNVRTRGQASAAAARLGLLQPTHEGPAPPAQQRH